METHKITLTLKDNKLIPEIENVNFETALQMTGSFLIGMSKNVYAKAEAQDDPKIPALTKAQLQYLKETMYDQMNICFTNILDKFAPEIEARPNITVDAIERAGKEILQEEINRIEKEKKLNGRHK